MAKARGKAVRNWARNESCRPTRFTSPQTIEELQATVRQAAEAGLRLRVIGAGHSWSAAAMSDDWLLSLDGLNRLIECDESAPSVTVEAGMRLTDLNAELEKRDLALANLGSVSAQSVAGATCTGTHGSHLGMPVLAGMIRSLEIVTANGELRRCERGSEAFRAVAVGLGAFGVVAKITLDCVPAFQLEESGRPLLFEEALDEILEVVPTAEYTKYWWLPHTPYVQAYTYRPTEKQPNEGKFGAWYDRAIANRFVFPTLLATGRRIPAVIPAINKLVRLTYFRPTQVVKKSHRAFNLAMPARHAEVEYALEWQQAPEALRAMRRIVEDGKLKVNFIQELRFAKGDDFFLSPASGRDTCYLGAYIAGGPSQARYFAEFEAAMTQMGGRPHWGKCFGVDADYLRSVYPGYDRFKELRHEWDPNGMFLSPFMGRILGIDA